LEIIGEASKNLSVSFREKHPHIEWRKMAGMRDKLIHGYISVDLPAVWAVVAYILPDVQKQIATILSEDN
jgi:uncharacterized protein with HEPN domain